MTLKPLLLLAAAAAGSPTPALAQMLTPEQQIAAAVAPAPEEFRDGAGVLGYAEDGSRVFLRESTNEIICVADEPGDERFHVACYHASLEPFMERGRSLRHDGKSRQEVAEIREAEARSGALRMPDTPAALYSLSGGPDAFDPERGEVKNVSRLYVVYMPYATEETTGLSAVPEPAKPWLMDAGLPWAHIMLMYPAQDQEED